MSLLGMSTERVVGESHHTRLRRPTKAVASHAHSKNLA
jgi:hypothetical protein